MHLLPDDIYTTYGIYRSLSLAFTIIHTFFHQLVKVTGIDNPLDLPGVIPDFDQDHGSAWSQTVIWYLFRIQLTTQWIYKQ